VALEVKAAFMFGSVKWLFVGTVVIVGCGCVYEDTLRCVYEDTSTLVPSAVVVVETVDLVAHRQVLHYKVYEIICFIG
jgi:hypothetical protein